MRKILLLGLLVLFAAGPTSAGSFQIGPRHKDESNGFQMQLPRKWEQVPTKFQDVVLIGKWSAKRAKRGYYAPELFVLRFVKATGAEDGETPADALKRGIPRRAGMLRFQPKSVWEYAERLLWRKHEIAEEDTEFKMSRKGHTAHFRYYRTKAPGANNREAAKQLVGVIAAEIRSTEQTDSSYGVIFRITLADEKDVLRGAKIAIKRFRILSPDDEDDEENGASDADIFVDSESKPEIWREARKRKLASVKGWAALDTKNYLIVYNKQVKKPLLKKIAKHIEAIRSQVYEKLFPPSREIKAVSVVRVCKDMAEYHRYGGPGGSAGYWSRTDEELVIPGGMGDSLRVLYHEAFHQYIHYAVGDVAPHSWFNEGHGDYFAGHNYSSRKFKPAPFRWRTGIIATALSTKKYVPLKKFLKYTQGEYYANAGLCYAQGWSFVYFLREVERKKIKKYKQYWGLLDRYFDAIKRNVKSVKENALEGLPPEPKDGPGKGGETKDPGDPEEEATPPAVPAEPEGLPRLPGLEKPFPGEHPEAGAAEDPSTAGRPETKTVAGPKITGVRSALDAAVDQAFGKIDIDQLEKDWVEWSK
jgi:hypothetical protein